MMNFDKSSLIRRDMDRDNVRAANTYVQELIRASEIYDADIVNTAVYGGCLCSYEDTGILSRLEQNQRSLYSSSLLLMITAEVPVLWPRQGIEWPLRRELRLLRQLTQVTSVCL